MHNRYCKKFVLLATPKALESFWCNWELGIGDVHKFKKNIAILPVKEKGKYDFEYAGNEYLQIYPHIDYEFGNNFYTKSGTIISKGYYVSEPVDKDNVRVITKLEDWLKN